MINIDYADLISGDSIPLKGIGHFHSPKLYELQPTKGIGSFKYNLYLSLFAWNKETLLTYMKNMRMGGLKAFQGHDELTYFDIITLISSTRSMIVEAIDFFIDEKIVWDNASKCFAVYDGNENLVGYINRENYPTVAHVILQLNYINLGEDKTPTKFASDEAQRRWEEAQKYVQKQEKKKGDKDNPDYKLGNIISKVCCVHHSYNLLNIYNLTIFQLYDQFYQVSYLRGVDLNDRIFSNHGGDNYKFENWLTPVNQNNRGDK